MAINKIVLNTESGEQVLVDLTGDNVTADKMLQGATAHDKSGENISGTIEYFDGSYECSGESTGGGGTSIEAWTGTVYIPFTLGGTAVSEILYTDENLNLVTFSDFEAGSEISITIAANTVIVSRSEYQNTAAIPTSNNFYVYA